MGGVLQLTLCLSLDLDYGSKTESLAIKSNPTNAKSKRSD